MIKLSIPSWKAFLRDNHSLSGEVVAAEISRRVRGLPKSVFHKARGDGCKRRSIR